MDHVRGGMTSSRSGTFVGRGLRVGALIPAGLSIAGAKAGLPRSFADRFFRRDSRSTSAEEPEGVEESATPT